MKSIHWSVICAALAATLACDDRATRSDVPGSIVINLIVPPAEPPQAAAADGQGEQAPIGVLSHLDSARVTVTGGSTNITQRLTANGTVNFTGTVTNLPVGTYTVSTAGYDLGAVDYFGRQTGVVVTAGGTTTATITFASFVPALAALPGPTTAFRANLAITTVAGADSYKVDVASDVGFTGAVTVTPWPKVSPATITFSPTGALPQTQYYRISAANSVAPAGGRASNASSVSLVTDQRPSADDPASAPNLGFFSTTSTTLDSLNVFPLADADWFSLNQCNGDSLTVTALASRLLPSSSLNSAVEVYNTAGLLVAQNNDSGGTNTDGYVKFAHVADAAYKVRVSGNQNTVGHYRLEVQGKAGANNLGASCKTLVVASNALSSGLDHSCLIRPGNIVDCWGLNLYGQLGNGTTVTTSSATRIAGATTFQQIAAGGFHTCAVTTPPGSPGPASCWGYNAFGEIGDGSTTNRNTPTPVTGGLTFITISAGDYHTCGITASNAAYCWGRNSFGQLGNNSTTSSTAPVAVLGGVAFQSISAGASHTCGLTTGNLAYCWGLNTDGQVGDASVTQRNVPVATFGGISFASVRAGGFHSCGVTGPGAAYCWGRNDFGEIGDASFIDRTNPTAVIGGLLFSSVLVGRNHTCGIAAGTTYCWGSNYDGELGDNTLADRSTPTAVAGGIVFASLAPGGFHTCAVQSSTLTTYCWGWNHFGQVGDGAAFNHAGPGLVSGGIAFKAISSGNTHTCAVANASSLAYCWGANERGQLGDASTIDHITPAAISGSLTFQTIGSGFRHTCGLLAGGQISCWGDNTYGQFGNGINGQSQTPVLAAGGATFTQLSVGDDHTCARNGANQIVCFGRGDGGQLGNGGTSHSNTPVTITNANYQSVTAGAAHTCGVTITGTAYCWGENFTGGLGDGTTTQRLSPQLVTGSNVFANLSAGFGFTCGRTTGNVALCWGSGGSGQLGNNAFTNSTAIVTVNGGLVWTSVTTNRNQTACGTTSAGMHCWGSNFIAQIGDGTFADRPVPTVPLTGQVFTTIASGDVHTCALTAGLTAYCWGNNEHGQLGTGTRTVRMTPIAIMSGPATAPPALAAQSWDDPFARDRLVSHHRGGLNGGAAGKGERARRP